MIATELMELRAMAKYRKIDPRIWNDEKFQTLSPVDRYLAMYCLTGQCNRIGIFKFSLALASEDTGIPFDELNERLDRVCHTLSWKHDKTRRVLYFPNWWKYNNPGSDKTMTGIMADIHEVPQTPLLNEFKCNTRHLSKSVSDTLSSFFVKGMPYQEQEQEQEQEQYCPEKIPDASEAGDSESQGDGKPKVPPPPQAPKFTPKDSAAAAWMWKLVDGLAPNQKPPDLDKWADQIRLMRERDKRSYDEIAKLFKWANSHHFWSSNIRSPDKLRAQWDRLTIEMKKGSSPKSAPETIYADL